MYDYLLSHIPCISMSPISLNWFVFLLNRLLIHFLIEQHIQNNYLFMLTLLARLIGCASFY